MRFIHKFINSDFFKPVIAVIIIVVFFASGYVSRKHREEDEKAAQTSQSEQKESDAQSNGILSEIKIGKSNIVIFLGLTAALVIISYKRTKDEKLKGKKDD